MSLLDQSTTASRDRRVVSQRILYACGRSRVVWRTGRLTSPGGSADFAFAEIHHQPKLRARSTAREREARRAATRESVSAYRGRRAAGDRSTAARHEER